MEIRERWEILRRRHGLPRPETLGALLEACGVKGEESLGAYRRFLQRLREGWLASGRLAPSAEERARVLEAVARLQREVEGAAPGRRDRVHSRERTRRALGQLQAGIAALPEGGLAGPVWGLALSGGGIRAAAFSLGVLQGLEEAGVLERFDYLSSVSGGYTACGLTYQATRDGGGFPFPHHPGASGNPPGGRTPQAADGVAWIRRHARYLTPGRGLDLWAFAVALARGTVINLLLILPPLALGLWLLGLERWPVTVDLPAWLTSAPAVAPVFLAALALALWNRLQRRGTDCPPHLRMDWLPVCLLWAAGIVFITPIVWAVAVRSLAAALAMFLAIFVPVVIICRQALQSEVVRRCLRVVGLPLPAGTSWQNYFGWGIKPIYLLEALAWFFTMGATAWLYPKVLQALEDTYSYPPLAAVFVGTGLALLVKLGINNLFYAYLSASSLRLREGGHRYFSVQYGDLLKLGGGLLTIGFIPVFDESIHLDKTVLAGIGVGGAALAAIGWWLRRWRDERFGPVAWLLRGGLALLLSGLVLAGYHALPHEWSWWFFGNAVFVLLFLWLPAVIVFDINYLSMHRYYRNRLMETFFGRPADQEQSHGLPGSDSDNLDLHRIDVGLSRTPYPLINAMVETGGSEQAKYAGRGGDSFIFSLLRVGGSATGWIDSGWPPYRRLNLATVMAISGAAVDPLLGFARSQSLGMLMTMLNIRLGYWLRRPGQKPSFLSRLWHESWLHLINQELFATPSEAKPMVRLSDGGHFDNLGLYELIRRRCPVMLVVDAGADSHWTFRDLARLGERVRVDFGAEIDLDPAGFGRDPDTRMAETPVVEGEIRYPDGVTSRLYYLKATLFPDLPHDLLDYHRLHTDFPHQPTTDQFYDEAQFEAYRELGYRAARYWVAAQQGITEQMVMVVAVDEFPATGKGTPGDLAT